MSIVSLNKVTLFGLTKEKQKMLNGLQDLGCMHLVTLREISEEPEKVQPEQSKGTIAALRFLLDCPKKRHQVMEEQQFKLESCVDRILQIKQLIREISDLRDKLAARIKEVEPWGDFKLPSQDDLAGLKLWFYIVPVSKIRLLPKNNMVWQIVHKDNRFAYLVVVAEQEPEPNIMPVPRTHTGTLSLSELNERLNKAELEIEDLQAERESYTRWILLLSKNLARAEDKSALSHAAKKTLDTEEIFAVQGWVAEKTIAKIFDFAQQYRLAFQIANPTLKEIPPTLLENPEPFTAGEDLVGFYKMPSYWDWDPVIIVFFSFMVFFAMIVSDAGYGTLLGILLMFTWRSNVFGSSRRRFRPLALSLVFSTIIWGMLVGSYFGMEPVQGTLLGQLKVFDINDFDTMMRLSIIIGVLHLSLANLFKARQLLHRGLRVYGPLGWFVIIWGGVLLWFNNSFVNPESWFLPVAQGLLSLGFIMVFLFSSDRPIKKPFDSILKVFDGLKSLTGVTKIFGDVLSYLRLFALGLASASLAVTFNNLASHARDIEGLGLLYSLLILFAGHSLNLLLSLMSAVVHGMRLNCIEFFNWGLAEEGIPFKAFAKMEIRE